MKEFWMIRHAESQANAGFKTKNQKTTFLSDLGEKQAVRLMEKLSTLRNPDLIVYSSFPRSQLTISPYLDKWKTKEETWDVEEFNYLSQIKWANTSFEERKTPKEEYWDRNDPHFHDGDGAESYSDLLHRAERMLRKVLERKENKIWIVTHGQFMKAVTLLLMSEGLNKEIPSMKKFKTFMDNHNIPNCGLIRVKVEDGSYWISFKDLWDL